MINKLSDSFLTFLLLLPHLQGLEISDPGQVIYKDTKMSAVVEQEVVLECGPSLPDIYIWSFTKPGTETIRALLYDFGRGPKLQQLAKDLGDLQIISDSASLSMKALPTGAEGLYTCQALFDSADGAELYYYYVYLQVLVPVSKPFILLNESSAAEGSPFWMRCGLSNGTNPIRYSWEQEDQRGLVTILPENDSSMIEFTRVSRHHRGWYRCLVRNEVNQELSDRIWLDVFFGPDPPQINTTAHSVTDQGYAILENGNITLACRALSDPPSRYIWFYNDSEISAGSELTITRIRRRDTGNYTCLAQNLNLNTSSKKSVTLTVYYPPDGEPTCSILPKNNYTDLALICSWDGGCPPATVYWRPDDNREPLVSDISKVSQIQSGPATANNSTFVCYGSHVALNTTKNCNTGVWLPDGEPRCSANSSNNNDHLMLSCSWEGGSPEALLWWTSSSRDIQSAPEENSSTLVLHSSGLLNGKVFICHAKHPLARRSAQCVARLEAPVLVTQRSVVPVYEGDDVQLTCAVSKSYPATTEITWYNNVKQRINGTTKKYVLEPGPAWFHLTIMRTERPVDSGQYWCSANNAVGGAEISVSLLVMSYPMPPDVTISRLSFSGRQRTDVNLEWSVKSNDNLTGFLIERTCDVTPYWQKVADDLDPRTHSYLITDLDPGARYAFRVTAINRRTFGNPSETMSPVPVPVSKPYTVLSDTSAEEGTSVWMSCGLGNGTEPIHYIWELERLDGSVSILSEGDGSLLTITRVSRNHTGWYRCLARNEINQQGSDRIWLDVLYGPDLPQVDASAYEVTENGFSVLENRDISLLCRALSNPPGQYVWFFNDSLIHTGPQLNIPKILRTQAGDYTCLSKNTHLNAHSERSINLTVYYPPDGIPSCTVFPANNYTDLKLFCSWYGGYPPAFLKWTSYRNEDNDRGGFSEVSRIHPGPGTANDSVFTCIGSHDASNTNQSCDTRAWRPHGDPRCFASSSLNNERLVLSCSWERGSPRALLWWASGSGDMLGVSKEETNILVLSSNNGYSGEAFVCHSKHPLAVESKRCVLNLDAPVLMSQHSSVSVTEGSDAQLTCNLTKHRPAVTEIIWYNSTKQRVGYNLQKYILQQEAGWSGLTVRGTDGAVDGGQYRCSATNAVGSAEIPVTLLVMMSVSKPQLVLNDASPVEGSSLWMRCTVEKGTGPINYTWEHESLMGLITTLAKGNSSPVNITGVTRNHTGWIRCLARNSVNQQLSDRLWLSVLFGPDPPQIDVVAFSATDRGYAALENANVSLTCSAPANPPGQYVWFYNNSQIYTGPQLIITKIQRVQAGYYTCLVLNTQLNTRSKKTITLSVYYPPDGAPLCSIAALSNYADLALSCSWVGGFPPATLSWGPYADGGEHRAENITVIRPGSETASDSVFTCSGSHVAQRAPQSCLSKTWLPYGELGCLAYATRNNEYLMLSCSWEGGVPRALLWWSSSTGDVQGTSEENANILVLRPSASYSGKAFTCNAKHPLAQETKQCVLELEAPVLMTQRSVVSVYEGNDVQLTCILSKNCPAVTEVTWYNNMKQKVGGAPQKYVLQQAAAWSNLTVLETDSMVDSGQYWCSAANAVGGAEIPILLLVMRYPMPPNVTITKLMYSHHQRTDVNMDWQVQTVGELTGFFIELQKLPASRGRSEDVLWQKVPAGLESTARSYRITGLDPSGRYSFRVTAVNRRTTGHPSQVKRPVNPEFRAYPAVIGAAVGGMILATLATALLFVYVLRNRNTNPRLHDLVFGRQNSQSRENINLPEDEIAKSSNSKQMPE